MISTAKKGILQGPKHITLLLRIENVGNVSKISEYLIQLLYEREILTKIYDMRSVRIILKNKSSD